MDGFATRYPIVLVHGIASRDDRRAPYWGRIVPLLRAHGLRVYMSGTDAWGTIERNAERLKAAVLEVLKREGCQKVNLIAHSKGGLESRYMISALGMAERVASLTTIATPHRGSLTADKLYALPDGLFRALGRGLNAYARRIGDEQPDFCAALRQLRSSACEQFNRSVRDAPGVYYQSYASAMRRSLSDVMLAVQHFVVFRIEGENDGLVSVESAKWGAFRGVLRGGRHWGVSHLDTVDVHRQRLGALDVPQFYLQLARELAGLGF